ncbi:MAG: YkgJ family cysteine cluster protein [Deltaproteobacteria bacterium]|jgi:Fe-S-cluster containining protein|nr:YkgJ family cysteine cluster protein [Deltaproteobacteria bacterium]
MKKIACRRCGTCCIKGGPVLHGPDLALMGQKIIRPDQLVVIRTGEPAYNPGPDAVEPAACEMLKIQGKGSSWECLFYNSAARGCTIHDNRPLECRLLQCRDTTAILAITGQDCLSRQDLIKADDPVMAYIQAFEQCSWPKINTLLLLLSPESIQEAEQLLGLDLRLRQEALSRLHFSLAQEFFYFGRPLFQSWNHAAVQLTLDDNNIPRLKRC